MIMSQVRVGEAPYENNGVSLCMSFCALMSMRARWPMILSQVRVGEAPCREWKKNAISCEKVVHVCK